MQILQLIPRPTILGDFPIHFIDQYVHWLNLDTWELEFRPVGSAWTPEPSNWRLHISEPGTRPRATFQKLSQNGSPIRLVDVRSNTFAVVSNMLSPLESQEHIIATHASQSLEVTLPRLRLSFFVNSDWDLECRSMLGYVVDKIQSCGTMFGLENKLILCSRPNNSEESLLSRRVIIPRGKIFFRTDKDFTIVSIKAIGKHVRWHEYTIDTDLRCLKCNASLSSKLYLCYLHALTSHCLPDPLLGHTGTEEALYILRSAICRSFQRLDSHDAKLLNSISKLTPERVFCPPHRRSMATVQWNNLPALSHHHDFYGVVRSIFDHARALEAFYDKPVVFDIPDRNELLLNRAASRNKSYYPSDLQVVEQPSSPNDVKYRSRDIPDCATAEHVAYRTSWSIWNDSPFFDRSSPEIWDLMTSWGSLGPASPASSETSLRYSRYWLEFDATQDWFVLYDLCRQAVSGGPVSMRIRLSFCLSAAAYGNSKYTNIVPFFVAFALAKRCLSLDPPPYLSYTLSDGVNPNLNRLKDLVSRSALPIASIPTRYLIDEETDPTDIESQREAEYDTAIRRESTLVANSILRQWPDYTSVDFRGRWFKYYECRRSIEEYSLSISRNIQLRDHVQELQRILSHYRAVSIPLTLPYEFSPNFLTSYTKIPSYSIHEILLSCTSVPTPSADAEPFPPEPGSDNLEDLIKEFRDSQQPLLQLYGNELSKSHREHLGQNASQPFQGVIPSYELLHLYHDECSKGKDELFSQISATLAPSQDVEKISGIAGLWPPITPRSILGRLVQGRIGDLPDHWKIVIERYAVSLIKYQQSKRLLELLSGEKHEELLQETKAIRSGVLAESTPDWLLVQVRPLCRRTSRFRLTWPLRVIEANILARPVQVAVAREMISPSSNRNITLQLNMGEGKSSVIVPLIASTLANGSNLMRVVTLKPLSNQMFQILATRLSGLLNRPIFYIPFSRSLRMDISLVNTLESLYRRCVVEGGVLVAQPEHILSQKLMHIDFLRTSHGDEQPEKRLIADKLGVLQNWMADVTRDVLDESDELLHVRYQLVYTAGEQMPVDDHPNRWTIIQQVFGRLQEHAKKLHADSPKKFEFDTTRRGFPIIRVLDSTVYQKMATLIIKDASEGRLSNLQLGVLSSPIREAARRFMAQKVVTLKDSDSIRLRCEGTTLFKGILLLRGLLMEGEGVLGYVLKERRWRVDYGLDPSRTLLAVPYRAKVCRFNLAAECR